MIEATHTNPRPSPNVPATRFALRPSPEAVTAGAGQVQRDTNGDGWFTQADVNGVQNLNATFKIHSGSKTNTDSAGCQTIHSADYAAFMGAVRGNATQDRWQYVLTETSPGRFRNIDAEAILPGNREVNPANPRQAAPDRAPQDPRQAPPERGGQNPRNPQQPGQPDQNERPGQAPPQMGPRRGGQAAIGPDDPNHQDYAKHEAIRIGVQKLGFQGEAADNMTAALLLSTKQVGGLNRIDDIKFNEANSKHAEGTFAIATYRPFGDKTPFFHARVDVAEATQQPTEKTFSQVESFNQQQAKQIALAEQQAQEKRQNPDGPSQQPPGGSTMKGPNIG